MPFVPDGAPDREAELAAQAGPRGYTFRGDVKQPGDENKILPGFDPYNLGPSAGAAAGSFLGGRAVPDAEEGSGTLSRLVKPLVRAGSAGVGAGMGAISSGKEPTEPMIGGAVGEAVTGPLVGAGKWLGGKVASSFELGKYIGKVGNKVGEIFEMPPLKNARELYDALRYDPKKSPFDSAAGDSIRAFYDQTKQKILSTVGEGRAIMGDAAKGLRGILRQAEEIAKTNITGEPMQIGRQKLSPLQTKIYSKLLEDPITVADAMDYAKELGKVAARNKSGALGKLNTQYRDMLAQSLDNIAPGQNLGADYLATNAKYARAMEVLRSFDANKIFTTGKEPKLIRAALQKASNDAERSLAKVGASDLDQIIRLGNKPGVTPTTLDIGGSGHLPWPLTALRLHVPRKTFEISPMRPPQLGTSSIEEIVRAIGAGTGAQASGE